MALACARHIDAAPLNGVFTLNYGYCRRPYRYVFFSLFIRSYLAIPNITARVHLESKFSQMCSKCADLAIANFILVLPDV